MHSGVAAGVGTRDAELRPSFTRGWGPEVSADGSTLALCVIAPSGSPTRANLEDNGAIAVGFSPPTIARALQIKGTTVSVGAPSPEDLERAQRHLRKFSVEAEQIGIPERVSRRIFGVPADFASVTLLIEEVFDQTPGAGAGRRL